MFDNYNIEMPDILAMCINQAIAKEFMFSNKRQPNSILNVYQKDMEEIMDAIREKYNYDASVIVTLKNDLKKARVLADGKHIKVKSTETYGDVYTIMPTFHELVNREYNKDFLTQEELDMMRVPGIEERNIDFPLTMLYENVDCNRFTESPTLLLDSVLTVTGINAEKKAFYESESFNDLLTLQQYAYNNNKDKTPRVF